MIKNINRITDDVLMIYSHGYDCYYFRNVRSLLVSLQDYETPGKALTEFNTDKVIWVEDKKKAMAEINAPKILRNEDKENESQWRHAT